MACDIPTVYEPSGLTGCSLYLKHWTPSTSWRNANHVHRNVYRGVDMRRMCLYGVEPRARCGDRSHCSKRDLHVGRNWHGDAVMTDYADLIGRLEAKPPWQEQQHIYAVDPLAAEAAAALRELSKDAERYRYCRDGGYLDFCFGADPTDATVDEEMVKHPRAAAP